MNQKRKYVLVALQKKSVNQYIVVMIHHLCNMISVQILIGNPSNRYFSGVETDQPAPVEPYQ